MFGSGKRTPPRAVAFDIIGTLFPLDPLRASLTALGLPPAGLELWFATAQREACALALTGGYETFATLLEQSLTTILAEQRLPPTDRAKEIVAGIATLPARAGAHEGIERLRSAGVPLLALTNGTEKTTREMLAHAGLEEAFAHIVSTDAVKRAKPAAEVYHEGARVAGVAPHELTLIAAHPWDIHGASAAGLGTAYLSADRPTVPALRQPFLSAPTLPALADALVGG
ncbi:haloacid dehalogenase type II [Sphingomonas sp.]|uniref:haloacid dehalogenase type II n=1 Tax=Sphingomonas sp. TaxID=28214 RepID=UPI003AFF7C02